VPEPHRPAVIGSAHTHDERWTALPAAPQERSVHQQPRVVEDEIDVGRYADALLRRWKALLIGAFLGGALGFSVAHSRPIRYEGVTTLVVFPPPKLATAAIGPTTYSASTYRALVENLGLVSQVIAEVGLDRPPASLRPQTFLEQALAVDEVRGTRLIKVRVRLADPKQAAEAANRLAAKAVLLNQRLGQQEGSASQAQLKDYLDQAAGRLQAAESGLLNFQKAAQIDLLNKDTQAMLEKRGDLLKLMIAIEGEKASLRTAEAEIQKQEKLLPARRALAAEEALRRTDETKEVLDPSNPFVNPVYQSLDFQIATSRSRLAALEQQWRAMVGTNKLAADELPKLSLLYGKQIEQARLQNNYELAKRVYSDLTVRYEESRTEALLNSAQLQMVDEAIPPDRPISRRRAQSLLLGATGGLGVTGLLILILAGIGRRQPEAFANS
jgi:polysaccharide biosynthesis transport protein